MNPAIVLVAPEHAVALTDEFGRYVRDYDVLTTTSVEEAEEVAHRVVAEGGQVAMFVAESQLPGYHVLEAFALLAHGGADRPPARRRALVALPRRRAGAARRASPRASTTPSCSCRAACATRSSTPRSCEMLSDWGSTVAAPEVDTVRIVTPAPDALTLGDPRLPRPDGDAEPHLLARQRAGARRDRPRRRHPDLPAGRGRRPRDLLAHQRA